MKLVQAVQRTVRGIMSPQLLAGKKEEGEVERPARFSAEEVKDTEWIYQMARYFLEGGTLPLDELEEIVTAAKELLCDEPTMVSVAVPDNGFLTILGDTHGQYDDLYTVLEAGVLEQNRTLIFNGDIVDRGPKQIQLITMALLLKIAFPMRVYLVRGNHETREMNESTAIGFKDVATRRYGVQLWHKMSELFDQLPIAALVQGVLLCVHGGLPCQAAESLGVDEIRSLQKGDLSGLAHEILWNDSSPARGVRDNQRGPGTYTFGSDVTRKFVEQNSLRLVVRAHDVRMGGYSVEHNKRLVTVFSAPNYCHCGNTAAFLHIPAKDLQDFGIRRAHCITFFHREVMSPERIAALRRRVMGPERKRAVRAVAAACPDTPKVAFPETPKKAAKRQLAQTPPKVKRTKA
jgi:diadenosine tetraphosphatase ApaH/serine/threonine PP2A family protein phosphatase